MTDSTPSKQQTIYARIRDVASYVFWIVAAATAGYSWYNGQDGYKALLEGVIAGLIVGVPLWGILSAGVYIFRDPKASSPDTAKDLGLGNKQTQQNRDGC